MQNSISPAQFRFLDMWHVARAAAASRDINLAGFVAARRALAKRLALPRAKLLICPNMSVPWAILNSAPFPIEIVSDPAGLGATFYNYYYLQPALMEAMIARADRLIKKSRLFPQAGDLRKVVPSSPEARFQGLIWFLLTRAIVARPAHQTREPEEEIAALERGRDRRLLAIHSRLANVSFEAKDLAAILEAYDSPDSFFLIDQRSFSHDLDREELLMCRRLLPNLKGKACVLCYDSYAAKLFEYAAEVPWAFSSPWLPRFVARNYMESSGENYRAYSGEAFADKLPRTPLKGPCRDPNPAPDDARGLLKGSAEEKNKRSGSGSDANMRGEL